MTRTDYQPRYVAYCLAHGRTPAAMLEHDRAAWPGGCMAGFIVWIGGRWRAWKAETNWRGSSLSQADHDAFDAWLAAQPASAEAA